MRINVGMENSLLALDDWSRERIVFGYGVNESYSRVFVEATLGLHHNMNWVDAILLGEFQTHVWQFFVLLSTFPEIFNIVLDSKSGFVSFVL
jgi:hypothetical protein